MPTGGCLCGAVRYEIAGSLRNISHCHCGMCRKVHGAAFGTYGSMARKRLKIVAGQDALRTYRSSEGVSRQFCGTCGGQLFFARDAFPDGIAVTLGTLDGDPGGRPVAHIYAGDRAPWYEITDSLPQYPGEMPEPASSGDQT